MAQRSEEGDDRRQALYANGSLAADRALPGQRVPGQQPEEDHRQQSRHQGVCGLSGASGRSWDGSTPLSYCQRQGACNHGQSQSENRDEGGDENKGERARNLENPKRLAFLAGKFPPPLEFRWRAGPYRPPVVNVGMVLHDEHRGEDVKVEGMTDAPIPWPAASYRAGRRESLLPILCGDLVLRGVRGGRIDRGALLGRELLHGGGVEAVDLRGQRNPTTCSPAWC